MEFVVASDNLPELAKFRTRLKTAFSTQYIGWDEDYDSQFDSHAVWFGLKRNENMLPLANLSSNGKMDIE